MHYQTKACQFNQFSRGSVFEEMKSCIVKIRLLLVAFPGYHLFLVLWSLEY